MSPSFVSALPPVITDEIRQADNNGGFVASGLTANEEAGRTVTFISDISGDGISDYVMGAPGASPLGRTNAGQVYVVFGKTDGAPADLEAVQNGIGGFMIFASPQSEDPETQKIDYDALSGVGDFNGDGIDDILYLWSKIGKPEPTPSTGFAHVIFGKSSTGHVDAVDLEAGTSALGCSFKTDANSPIYATPIGDFNGDGYNDICIIDNGSEEPNEAFVLFGRRQEGIVEPPDIRSGDSGIVITTPDHSGHFVVGAGDVNGDGFDDIVFGLLTPPPGVTKAEFHILHGRAGNNHLSLADEMTAGRGNKITSAEESDYAICSGAGDVNGDGLDDVLVFTSYYPGTKPAHVLVFGKTAGGPIDLDSIIAEQGGGFRFDAIWTTFTAAGDVDGDGLGDLVGGYPFIEFAEATVVSGKTDSSPITWPGMIDNGSGSFRTSPDQMKDELHGWSVSSAGDMNLDGFADILVGAPLAHNGAITEAGEAFVIFSPVTPKPATRRYKTAIKNGAAPWRGVGMTTNAIQGTPFSHVWLTYEGGHGPDGVDSASFVTVAGPNPVEGLSELPDNAVQVAWGVVDQRVNGVSGAIRIRYLDSHIEGLVEDMLRIYRSATPAGPWVLLENQSVDADRNLISGTLAADSMAGIYVLAESSLPATPLQIIDAILLRAPVNNQHDANSDKVVDGADVIRALQ